MEKVTKQNIWNFEQNKPSLVVKDICEKYPEVDPDFVYEVLLKRGVFKWLAVRRDLIKLKNVWKDEITELNKTLSFAKSHKVSYKFEKEKGIINTLIKCRQSIRKLCHSDRWRSPDFDRRANLFLNSKEEK
uniref:Uncharacterized protein n=1 Tax=viral metagenome TaxID=1070528 RepID=A0A6H1ZSU7_9ZZZZ